MVSRRYRNRRIGDFLKELKLVEGRNTGIPTILRAMEANGSGLPVFETDKDRTFFTVILPIHKEFLIPAAVQPLKKKTRRSAAEIKELIMDVLAQNGDLSSSELATEMGYTKVTAGLARAVKELMAEGKVVYLEPDKKRTRNQKLCLVERRKKNP